MTREIARENFNEAVGNWNRVLPVFSIFLQIENELERLLQFLLNCYL
jgi:hypothetical protein